MFGKKSALDRLAEEQLYETVALEIKNHELREGLWAKALAEAKGDQDQAKGVYIKLRVQSLKDEFVVAGQIHQEALKEEERQKEIARLAEEEKIKREAQEKQRRARALASKLQTFDGVKLDARDKGGWVITHKGKIVMNCDSLSDVEQFIVVWSEKLEREKSENKLGQNSSSSSSRKGIFIFIVVIAVILWLVLG